MIWVSQPAPGFDRNLIVFDGDCVLCSRMARFVDRHDRAREFDFAAIQSPVGRALAERFRISADAPETFIVIRNGVAYFKSDAGLKLLGALPGWRWTTVGWIAPRILRDAIYDLVARNRFRWFGRKVECALADPRLRSRIIDSLPVRAGDP